MIPNCIPVLIEITNLHSEKRGSYKVGDILIGSRGFKPMHVFDLSIWVCFGEGERDFDVFELGYECRIWNGLSKQEAEDIKVSEMVNKMKINYTEWAAHYFPNLNLKK